MRRILIAILVIMVAWIALKNGAYSALLGTSERAPDKPDYFYDEVWLERPADVTPGGWVTPWGVDVLIIAPPATTPARKGILPAESDPLKETYREFADALALNGAGFTLYAPSYRSPSPASGRKTRALDMETAQADMVSAMRRYLSADNRERGVLIVAAPDTQPLLETALEALPQTEAFRERFAGIVIPDSFSASDWETRTGPCSPVFDGCVVASTVTSTAPITRFVLPSLPRPQLVYSADADFLQGVKARIETLSNWLDLNATKPAEPFDTWAADEVVDVAPIRRPNQDVDISGDRGD